MGGELLHPLLEHLQPVFKPDPPPGSVTLVTTTQMLHVPQAQLEQASHPQCCSVDQRLHAAHALLGLGARLPLADKQTLARA